MYSPMFHKALILLDESKYEEGEKCLIEAISQSEIVEGYPNVRQNRKAGVVSLAK